MEGVNIFSGARLKSEVDSRDVVICGIDINFIDDEVVGRILKGLFQAQRFTYCPIEIAARL